MLLTVTTTMQPARDLGYLLAKHPDRCQSFELSYGMAHVFYPEVAEDRCTAALLLDFDPVGLVRGRRWGTDTRGTLAHYVNDRPYVASSFFSVAIGEVFTTAMKGQSKDRPELAGRAIPLEAELTSVPCRGGEPLLRGLFEPLGYRVDAERLPLDERFPDWGEAPFYRVRLSAETRLSELLTHLYVLLPVLDNRKHYWVGDDEIEKLLAKGGQWLKTHPLREEISRRYLKHRRPLFRAALERLVADEEADPEERADERAEEEEALERPISLNDTRMGAVIAVLKERGARSVLDVGCGEGKLLSLLVREKRFERIRGMDVSTRSLEIASLRLKLGPSERARERIDLFQGSLTYRDERLSGFDALCAVEVIEHIDPTRLGAFERTIFEFARPDTVVVTTPNSEYNVRFDALAHGELRHRDHRFEWSRREFREWAQAVATRHEYEVRFLGIGAADPEVGEPTQMGVFSR